VNHTFTTPVQNFGKFYARLGAAAGPAIRRGEAEGAKTILADLRRWTVSAGKFDTRAVLQGWRSRQQGLKLTIDNAAPHHVYVERGRRPGKPPPSTALEGWATRKLGDRRLAFPVARAIGRRGIKPTPLLTRPGFGQHMARRMMSAIQRELDIATKAASRG
jgi:hypothetical protein